MSRVFVTGGAGFIGRRVIERLADRGDEMVAAVRAPERSAHLRGPAVKLIASDLGDVRSLTDAMRGCDGAIHLAGMYRVGIRAAERPAMWDANVAATERVLDAAVAAGVGRIVHVSTVNVFGDTKGRVVDETYRRDLASGFVSYYDETKYRAHEAAERRAAQGAPIVIVQPGGVYGPGDHAAAGQQLEAAFRGRLRYRALDDVGLSWVHVDDVAAGIVAALERGRAGESYVLAGPAHRLGEAIAIAAGAGGRRPPRLRVPTSALRLLAPLARRLPEGASRLLGVPANLDEALSAAAGVTYWAASDKAERELGFRARDLGTGVSDAFAHP